MRLVLLFGSLTLALLLAVWTTQVPRPRGADAPATAFSAARAMTDIEQIARAPHPVGSAEHARVRAYLTARMTQLGLSPQEQSGPLSPGAVRRLKGAGGDPDAADNQAVNLIGVLPGKDRTQPAVAVMAHYDTVVGSPGAADDSTGVAAVLEIVRALKARGPVERDVVVILTDAEELGLDGARIFFGDHPLRDRIGAVVNLEARGGGGRAAMFETGRRNGPTIDLFQRSAVRADGGTTSTSLAVFMYEHMPNGTDFTIPKDRGIGGLNFAFIGRPAQYHSADATPANLDQGALQHLGSQALEAAYALVRASALPGKGPNRVYSDVFGRLMLSHSAATGWGLLALTALFGAFAAWRARHATGLTAIQVGRGLLDGLWFLSLGLVLAQAARLLAGPVAGRAGSPEAYYVLLRRLPWMEAGAVLAVLALALFLLTDARRTRPRILAGAAAVLTLVVLLVGGFSPVILGAGVIVTLLSLLPGRTPLTPWGGWLGVIALIFLFGCALQGAAPEAALLFIWPVLLAAGTAALAALIDPRLERRVALIAPAAVGVLGGAWLMGLGHFVFLGVGMDLPGALALIGLLILLFLRPLVPSAGAVRPVLIGAAACLVLACGLNLAAHVAEPRSAVAEALP